MFELLERHQAGESTESLSRFMTVQKFLDLPLLRICRMQIDDPDIISRAKLMIHLIRERSGDSVQIQ